MSEVATEPTEFQHKIDDAFFEFMLDEGYYIREGTGVITNPNYKYSLESLYAKWMKIKKDTFGTTTNQEPKWVSKARKASSR